jgi:hypothetical protein
LRFYLKNFRPNNIGERLSENPLNCQKMSLFFSCGMITNHQTRLIIKRLNLFLRIIIALTFSLWLVSVLLGKGGFVHILLLVSIGVSVVEILRLYRRRLTENVGRTN